MFSCEYHEIFKDTYFEEHLQTAASAYGNQSIAWQSKLVDCFYDGKIGWKNE